MPKRSSLFLLHGVLFSAVFQTAFAQIPAFPGAEGAGAFATGGRGGSVFIVTNLNRSGPGSFSQAVSQSNRIIVFAVSGIIDLQTNAFRINQPNLTIAGQTAPGEGICFKSSVIRVMSNNVIMTHLRFRRGYNFDGDRGDSVAADPDSATTNIMFAHLSASWGTDENLTLQGPNLTTAQCCIASEGLDYPNPTQTPPNHSEGSLWGTTVAGGRISMHHMLYAHNRLRNPRVAPGDHLDKSPPPVADFRNSVIYNARDYTSHVGEEVVWMNWGNNYYKDGPDTQATASQTIFTFASHPGHRMYADGNHVFGSAAKTANNWQAMRYLDGLTEGQMRTNTEFTVPPVTTEPALTAYTNVLENAGAILPARDAVDWRIVNDVRNGTGRIIDKETDLPADQRWPDYRSLPPPLDSDADGIPNYWEAQFGLATNNASDSAALTPGGYANIEHYFNNTDPQGGTLPIVYVGAMVSRAHTTNGVPGVLRVRRTGDLSAALTVHHTVGGTAVAGADYATLPGVVTIPAGARWADINIVPRLQAMNDRMVVLTLNTGNPAYHVGCPRSALVVIVVNPTPDTDEDGMPDYREDTHGLDKNDPADATQDSDGDGFTSLQEFHAATDPNDFESAPRILEVVQSGNDATVTFATVSTRVYQVERSEDLPGSPWTLVSSNVFGTGGLVQVTDAGASSQPKKFYRLRVTP